ncbi:acetyl-CoA acyltransferase/3-oxo-5,6-didehydrosuberyl-CoA/3-oxoadipyl-CoA thiolase [Kaistella treverensis]|uniref:Acetyl-CoA acyltransferase/3-oxo-5,6-didehydrosuberyl-CoA/3-oxoadipyl-CoA thiolase n=1 Tax=Kaistella treverensis TaxID=631455 RepID=A0A1I3K656_9FLAO|nr:acetyl-CoA C-acyltransferase [Kaistella treverensis]SFI67695.1 acetyl-CoA acyltransferase/3-oxo-5,6-didehydrosuberyl-CoA/3-oxoadipyl-CoA thiolase [Kaistella treverensis]
MTGKNAYIIDGTRSAIGNFKGSLAPVRTDDLMASVIKSLIEKNPNVPVDKIDDVIIGCANQAGEDNRNIARMSLLLAGLPVTVPGETVNRLCASGMSAIVQASRAIKSGEGDLFIAGGVEGMSRGPYAISKTENAFGTDQKMYDTSFGWRFINPQMEKMYGTDAMGKTAENLAEMFHISREEQDEFALNSQQKAKKAQDSGRLAEEISDIVIPQRKGEPTVVNQDEFIKPNSTMEILGKLRAAFVKENGTVTAGNASGLNDGAAAVIVASDEAVEKYNLKPLAKIVTSAVTGTEPRIMGIGPVDATKLALKRANLTLEQMDVIELNEAFSAQSIAVLKGLEIAHDDPRVNINGGAIALGHPLGMSGTRITYSAALELNKTGKKYALATMCIGVGQGYAVILENTNV